MANRELVRSADLTVTEDICSRLVSLVVHDHIAPDGVTRHCRCAGRGLAVTEEHAPAAFLFGPATRNAIHEYLLIAGRDVAGSKVRFGHFWCVLVDMLRICFCFPMDGPRP